MKEVAKSGFQHCERDWCVIVLFNNEQTICESDAVRRGHYIQFCELGLCNKPRAAHASLSGLCALYLLHMPQPGNGDFAGGLGGRDRDRCILA